jgi:hypothetical protein
VCERVGKRGVYLYTSSSGRPVGCMSILLKQHLNTHKQQLRALGLQIIIHHTHAPVHKQSHRLAMHVYACQGREGQLPLPHMQRAIITCTTPGRQLNHSSKSCLIAWCHACRCCWSL